MARYIRSCRASFKNHVYKVDEDTSKITATSRLMSPSAPSASWCFIPHDLAEFLSPAYGWGPEPQRDSRGPSSLRTNEGTRVGVRSQVQLSTAPRFTP